MQAIKDIRKRQTIQPNALMKQIQELPLLEEREENEDESSKDSDSQSQSKTRSQKKSNYSNNESEESKERIEAKSEKL